MRALLFLAASLAIATTACGSGSDDPDGGGGNGDGGGGNGDATMFDATPTYDAGEPDATPSDCDNLPSLPVTSRFLDHIPWAEDFTFDDQGNLVGISDGGLFRTPYDGAPALWTAVNYQTRGARLLANGTDLVVSNMSNNELTRIDPQGVQIPILAGLPEPNGIAIGMDGFIYLANSGGQIRRIDPDTGQFTVLWTDQNRSFDGITFNLDYSVLYVNEEAGDVHKMTIDAQGNAGTPEHVVTLQPQFLLDGMAVDECNNVYTLDMAGTVYRIDQQNNVDVVVQFSMGEAFIPALNFGSGVGGWHADKLYVMNFLDGVFEVDIGVRGKPEPHLQ
jgi:hypothetical protein